MAIDITKSVTQKDLRRYRDTVTAILKANLQEALRVKANLPYKTNFRSSLYEDIFSRQLPDGTVELFARDYLQALDAGTAPGTLPNLDDIKFFIQKRGIITSILNKKWAERQNKKKEQIKKLNQRLLKILSGNKNKVKPETIANIEESLEKRRQELKNIENNFKKDVQIDQLAYIIAKSIEKKGTKPRNILEEYNKINAGDGNLKQTLVDLMDSIVLRTIQQAEREAKFLQARARKGNL